MKNIFRVFIFSLLIIFLMTSSGKLLAQDDESFDNIPNIQESQQKDIAQPVIDSYTNESIIENPPLEIKVDSYANEEPAQTQESTETQEPTDSFNTFGNTPINANPNPTPACIADGATCTGTGPGETPCCGKDLPLPDKRVCGTKVSSPLDLRCCKNVDYTKAPVSCSVTPDCCGTKTTCEGGFCCLDAGSTCTNNTPHTNCCSNST
jgi:hypothetical protein